MFPGCGGVKVGTDKWGEIKDLHFAMIDRSSFAWGRGLSTCPVYVVFYGKNALYKLVCKCDRQVRIFSL